METGSQGRARVRLVPVSGTAGTQRASKVRWSRVKTARARVASGFYDREDVREKLLEAVLEEMARH
jgi:hypothetical protein